jgi:hypothetical protein
VQVAIDNKGDRGRSNALVHRFSERPQPSAPAANTFQQESENENSPKLSLIWPEFIPKDI